MIRYLHGRIAGTFDGGVIVDVNGIGYEVNVPDASVFFAKVGELPCPSKARIDALLEMGPEKALSEISVAATQGKWD